jgi:molybdopterin-guanine dinucleotide biosynthesis protein A
MRPTDNTKGDVSAIVLAGGAGTRMGGVDKARLRVGSEAFVERIARVLREVVREVLIVGGASGIVDRRAGCGPLAGIEAGLIAARGEWVIVIACDYPNVTRAAIEMLVDVDVDVIVPIVRGRTQPLFAVYSRRVLPVVSAALDRGEYRVHGLLEQLRVRVVNADAHADAFLNVNTPADFAKVGR